MKIGIIILVLAFWSSTFAWKKEAHIISLPIIEGAGFYSSISMLQQSNNTNTKASAITSLSLLTANATLGAFTMFGSQDNYSFLRPIHRYLGMAITLAGFWMSFNADQDKAVKKMNKNICYGYTAVTIVPIVMFSF